MLDIVYFEKENQWKDELSIYDHGERIIVEISSKRESPNISFNLDKNEVKKLTIQLAKFLKEK